MASPAFHSHLRLLTPSVEDTRVRTAVLGASCETSPQAPSGCCSGSRDIDRRESWGRFTKDGTSPRWVAGLKLEDPDYHEPTANLIVLVASLLMFAAAAWWGSAQLHHDAMPEGPAAAMGGEGARESGASARDAPARH